jgi:hypothetical protein
VGAFPAVSDIASAVFWPIVCNFCDGLRELALDWLSLTERQADDRPHAALAQRQRWASFH